MIDMTSPTVEANCFPDFLPESETKFSLRAKRTVSDGKVDAWRSQHSIIAPPQQEVAERCQELKITPLDRWV